MEDRVLLWLNIFLHYFRTMYKIFLSYDTPNIYIRGLYTHYTSVDILIHPKLFLVVVQVRLFQGIGNLPQWNFHIDSIVVEDTHWMIPPEMKHVFRLSFFFVERKNRYHFSFIRLATLQNYYTGGPPLIKQSLWSSLFIKEHFSPSNRNVKQLFNRLQ